MKQRWRFTKGGASRRSFLRDGIVAAGAATIGTKVLRSELSAFERDPEDRGPAITAGDVAILQFLTAAELIESDLWQQYNELGGIDAGNSGYVAALGVLDGDIMAGGGKSRLRGFIPGDARAAASTESVPCAAAPINQPTANATGSIKVSPRVRRATNHGQAGDADHRWPGVAVVTHVRGGMTDDPDVATTPMISHSTHSSAKSWRPSTGRSPATHGSTAQ